MGSASRHRIQEAFRDFHDAIDGLHTAARRLEHIVLRELGEEEPDDTPLDASMRRIISVVAEEFEIDVESLRGDKQGAYIARPRQLAMLLIVELCPDKSYPAIGRYLRKDHSTIQYGVRRARTRVENDKDWAAAYHRIKAFFCPEPSTEISPKSPESITEAGETETISTESPTESPEFTGKAGENESSPEVSPQTPLPNPSRVYPPGPSKEGPYPPDEKPPNDLPRKKIAQDMADVWREELEGVLPVPHKLPESRVAAMCARFREDFGSDLGQWRRYCQTIRGSPFLRGENGRGWRADIDWAVKPVNLAKVLEGKYEQGPATQQRQAAGNPFLAAVRNEQKAAESW